MAAALMKVDKQTELGSKIADWLRSSRDAILKGEAVRAMLIQMRDSDGSQDAHYDLIVAEAGYAAADWATADKAAHESFLELDSMYASQQNSKAAVVQACAKHAV